MRIAVLVLTTTAILIAGCGHDPQQPARDSEVAGQLSFSFSLRPAREMGLGVRSLAADLVRLADHDSVHVPIPISPDSLSASATVQGLHAGAWRVTVYAFDADNDLLASGSATVAVAAGTVTPVHIVLRLVGGVEIVVTWEDESGDRTQLSYVTLDGRTIHAYSARDSLLWSFTAGSVINRALVADLNQDGWRDAVFGTDHDGGDNAVVYAKNRFGNGLWAFTAGTSHWWPDDEMFIVSLRTADIDRDGTMEVVAKADHYWWFPERVCAVNAETGQLEGEYWNPGRASSDSALAVADLDGDGIMEVIVGSGNNNWGNHAVVYCLAGNAIGSTRWYSDLGRPADETYPYVKWVRIVGDVTGDAVSDIECGGGAPDAPTYTRRIDGASGAVIP